MAPWRKKELQALKAFRERNSSQPAAVCAPWAGRLCNRRVPCARKFAYTSPDSFSTCEIRPQNVYINICVCPGELGGCGNLRGAPAAFPFFTWPSILPAVEKERDGKREKQSEMEKKSLKEKLLSCLPASLLAIPAAGLSGCMRTSRALIIKISFI
jgi:hypothetical protein